MAKSPSSLMSFCSPFYFPANDCCFVCASFHIFVLPSISRTSRFVPHFPSQNPVEHACFRSLLQRTSFSFLLPFLSVLLFIVDFALTCRFYLYCLCNAFFLPFSFTGLFLKYVFELAYLFFIDLVIVYPMFLFLL